jgi:hypothetical protein
MNGAHKYGAQAVKVDGIKFPSKREARRWSELRLLERAGRIEDLKRQVRFVLDVNAVPICHYVADFTYREAGRLVVEDTKGVQTDVFKIKAKLMLACHGIAVLVT